MEQASAFAAALAFGLLANVVLRHELTATFMAGSGGRYEEHQFRKVIPGELEIVRKRLCDVLEDFGYAVLGDNPIQGKRRRRRSIWTATVLECQTQLTLALKPISDASTLATFDYGVEYMFTRADRQTLEREADAIIALATTPVSRTVCPSCHTEDDGAVRFCRACGTPVAQHDLPLDLELMRMSADLSSAHLEIIIGLVLQLLTLAVSLPMILLGVPGIVRLGWVVFAIGEFLSALPLLQGIHRLQSAVAPATSDQQLVVPRATSVEARASLPPRYLSVTEGTTELMNRAEATASTEPAKDSESIN